MMNTNRLALILTAIAPLAIPQFANAQAAKPMSEKCIDQDLAMDVISTDGSDAEYTRLPVISRDGTLLYTVTLDEAKAANTPFCDEVGQPANGSDRSNRSNISTLASVPTQMASYD